MNLAKETYVMNKESEACNNVCRVPEFHTKIPKTIPGDQWDPRDKITYFLLFEINKLIFVKLIQDSLI